MSMISATQKRRTLREPLKDTQAARAPGIYDGYGVRLVEQFGFTAVCMTGNARQRNLVNPETDSRSLMREFSIFDISA
jgi:2-methylisocitrate lyase-like PEP mutase family enzyme